LAASRGIAITAFALGILGLFTAGGLGVGSLLGLVLAGASLTGAPPPRPARDVAWAAIAANVFALLTILPVGGALLSHREATLAFFGDDPLPEPATPPMASAEFIQQQHQPPPPLPTVSAPAVGCTTRRKVQQPSPAASVSPRTAERPAEATAPVAPVKVGGAIKEPRKTRHVNPAYPGTAVQARVQGVVVLECTISATGKVVEVRTLRGVPLLSEAAIEAVRRWEYTPTVLNGTPVPVIMTVTVNFKLN
jgi:TonB family protein